MEIHDQQVEFIDREEELSQINDRICDWGSKHVICVVGDGGIGKTRLLNEIQSRYSNYIPQFRESPDEHRITMALVQEFANTDWSRELLTGARKMADELGIELREFDAESNITRMAELLEQAIALKPDLIILRLGTHDELIPALRHALDEEIKVVSFDNYLPENRITTRIVQDYLDSNGQLARQLAQDIGYKGNVLILCDETQALQTNRLRILRDVLLSYPEIQLVESVQSDYSQQSIYGNVSEILKKNPEINAVWSAWDEYTKPILQVLKDLNCQDISVYGYGLSTSQAEAMLTPGSALRATVDTCPVEVGRFVIGIAALTALQEPIEYYYSFKTRVIDPEYLKTLLDAQGKLPPDWLKMELPWTPRLHARQSAFSKEKQLYPYIPIIDFDDYANYEPQNILNHILLEISRDAFETYQSRLPVPDSDDELPDAPRFNSNDDFESLFNTLTKNNRFLFLFDTVDDDNRANILREVFKAFSRLSNFVCIVAGRHSEALFERLKRDAAWETALTRMDLKPFVEKFGGQYLLKKQEILGFHIDEKIAQNLLLLAGGRPILIDLAADWLARQIPLDWLKERDPNQIETDLAGPDREKKIKEFESQLVQHIASGRRKLDWLFAVMARIYPLDVSMIQKLRKASQEDAAKLFSDAQGYTFVKRLPDGRIKLHDVMQNLITDYVWPQIDADGSRSRYDSELAIEYYLQRIKELEANLKVGQASKIQMEKWRQELATLRGQYLYHLFYTNFEQATGIFKEMFESDTLAGQFSSRQILLDSVSPYIERLPWNDRYHILTRWIRHLIDRGQDERAREILDELFRVPLLSTEQRLGLLTNEANYYVLIGQLKKADESLDAAEKICLANPGSLGIHLGTVLNTRGWVYRQMGRHKLAAEYYEKARQESNEPLKVASILNNAAYVYSFEGNYEIAIQYCEEALAYRVEKEHKHGEALSYTTMGDIYRNMGKYPESLEFYNRAIEIFESEKDSAWLAYTYSRRGAVQRLLNKLVEARLDLNISIDLNIKKELPWTYHVLGCVSWNEEKLDEALQMFEYSQRLAREFRDIHTQINNVVGEAEVYYQQWMLSGQRNASLLQLIDARKKVVQSVLEEGYDFSHHYGRLLRVCADIAFDQKRYEEALSLYSEAYALLGKRAAGYGKRTFRQELDHIESVVLHLAWDENRPQLAVDWCKRLKSDWTAKQDDMMQAEGLIRKCALLETRIRLKSSQK